MTLLPTQFSRAVTLIALSFAGQASLPERKAEAGPTPSAHAAADAGRDAITTPASTSI